MAEQFGADVAAQPSDETVPDHQLPALEAQRIPPIILVVSTLVCLLIYVLRLDRVFGLFVDDAWYALLTKALATGQGYALINSPTAGILPLYPPAFPFLLSLVYRLSPQFPQNVWLLKSVSIAAMLATGCLVYRYFITVRKPPAYVALLIALATVLSPTLVFLATSTLMSECVFTLNFLLAVVVIERAVKAGQSDKALRYVLLAAVVAASAFLMRSIAVSLIAAGFIYFVKARLPRSALIFTATAVLLCAPWVIYARLHTPTPEQQREQGGHIVQPYTQQFWQRRAGESTFGTITVGDIPGRVRENLLELSGRDAARVLVTPLFEALLDPAQELQQAQAKGKLNTLFLSFILAALVLIGFVGAARARLTVAELAVAFSVGITVLWPWATFRFVLPLTPFLIFYLLLGVGAIIHLIRRNVSITPWRLLGAVAALLLAINLFANVNYLLKNSGATVVGGNEWLSMFDEAEKMMQQFNQSRLVDGVIATTNPAFVNLYTGRKTVSSGDAAANYEYWRRLGVRYIARVAVFGDAARPEESGVRIIYRSRRHPGFWVVDIEEPALAPR